MFLLLYPRDKRSPDSGENFFRDANEQQVGGDRISSQYSLGTSGTRWYQAGGRAHVVVLICLFVEVTEVVVFYLFERSVPI